MDEMLPLLRRLWAGEPVTHHGDSRPSSRTWSLAPLPVQQPLEFWTGGMVPAALRRCGRFADGWLPSACTPDEVAAARLVIDEAAAEAGRAISPEHFGVSSPMPPARSTPTDDPGARHHPPGCRPEQVVPVGIGGLRAMLERFLERRILQVRGAPAGDPDRVASRARGAGRRRARPPDVTRARPVELEFIAHDDPELLGPYGRGLASGTGWINVEPIIDEEHEPPEPGPFAFLGGSTHKVPTATWLPGRRNRRRDDETDHRRPAARVGPQRRPEAPRPRLSAARRMAGHPGPSPAGSGGTGAGRRRATGR